mgnify:CR=1 FL=1
MIAVQAGVGSHFLDSNPAETREALDAIGRTSRGTLNELRRLLGVLRGEDRVIGTLMLANRYGLSRGFTGGDRTVSFSARPRPFRMGIVIRLR